jgi:hypothetical protein
LLTLAGPKSIENAEVEFPMTLPLLLQPPLNEGLLKSSGDLARLNVRWALEAAADIAFM